MLRNQRTVDISRHGRCLMQGTVYIWAVCRMAWCTDKLTMFVCFGPKKGISCAIWTCNNDNMMTLKGTISRVKNVYLVSLYACLFFHKKFFTVMHWTVNCLQQASSCSNHVILESHMTQFMHVEQRHSSAINQRAKLRTMYLKITYC